MPCFLLFTLCRCKQRGQAAISANNVFFYMAYEGAVDIDKFTDPVRLRYCLIAGFLFLDIPLSGVNLISTQLFANDL